MSKFESEIGVSYGLMIIIAILAAVTSSFVTYKATGGSGKVAIVDIDRVANSAKSAIALREVRDGQLDHLRKMTEEAENRLKTETNEDNRKKLSEVYLAEINKQKDEFDQQYLNALRTLNQAIRETSVTVAGRKGIKVILSPDSVVEGGIDITDDVISTMR